MPFGCSKCGLCCQSVGILVENAKQIGAISPLMVELGNFPYSYNESGRCEKLSLENECTVYETRPLMCNVEKFHEKYFQEYSQDEFFKMNERECNLLKNQHNEGKQL